MAIGNKPPHLSEAILPLDDESYIVIYKDENDSKGTQIKIKDILSSISGGWQLEGNSGTDSSVNFIGTTDDISFVVKVNNFISGLISRASQNLSFGYQSLINLTSGSSNTVYGSQAAGAATTATGNVVVGAQSAASLLSGTGNSVLGRTSAPVLTTGIRNVIIGEDAGPSVVTQSNTVNIGYNSGPDNDTIINFIALGANSRASMSGQLAIPDLITTIKAKGIAAYADDAAAGVAGLTQGMWYQTTGTSLLLPVAGVLMIKQ